jgi:hypothetical protein
MPPVAEYVARVIKNSITDKKEKEEKLQIIDYRKAPEQEALL